VVGRWDGGRGGLAEMVNRFAQYEGISESLTRKREDEKEVHQPKRSRKVTRPDLFLDSLGVLESSLENIEESSAPDSFSPALTLLSTFLFCLPSLSISFRLLSTSAKEEFAVKRFYRSPSLFLILPSLSARVPLHRIKAGRVEVETVKIGAAALTKEY
jgi:hypothetical protein